MAQPVISYKPRPPISSGAPADMGNPMGRVKLPNSLGVMPPTSTTNPITPIHSPMPPTHNPSGGVMPPAIPPITYRPDVPANMNNGGVVAPPSDGRYVPPPQHNPNVPPVGDPRYTPPPTPNPQGGVISPSNGKPFPGPSPFPNPSGGVYLPPRGGDQTGGGNTTGIGGTGNPVTLPPDSSTHDRVRDTRLNETLAQRQTRLEALIAAGNTSPDFIKNLATTKRQIAAGMTLPNNTNLKPPTGGGSGDGSGDPRYTPPPQRNPNGGGVQLDNDPSTWHLGDLAELAPPVGTNTRFDDIGTSAALQARKQKIKAKAGVTTKTAAKTTPTPKKASGKAATGTTKTNTKKADTTKLTAKQQANLKKRPQPGTPARPYISRGISYNPLGTGGTLRV